MQFISQQMLEASEDLSERLAAIFGVPLFDESQRVRVSSLACSVAVVHSNACRTLLLIGMVPSALVVHRAQYEAVVRAVWALCAASDTHIKKLSAKLAVETEQGAKNLPSVAEMMVALSTKAHPYAYQTLANFKENSWKALNSYVHTGIHPLQRQESGYPVQLVEQLLRHCNGLSVVAGMQAAVLTGNKEIIHHVGELQSTHAECLPLL